MYAQDAVVQKQEVHKKAVALQHLSLDTQVFLKKQTDAKIVVRKRLAKENDDYAAFQDKELEKWKVKELVLEAKKLKNNKLQVEMCKVALVEKQGRMAFEKRMKIKGEILEVDRAKNLLKEEKARMEVKKQMGAAKNELLKIENAKMLLIKQQRREDTRLEELALNESYKAKLAKQEADREAALAETYAKQQHKVNMALLNVKSDADIAREDEERAHKIQVASSIKAEADFHAKAKARRAANMNQVAALKIQHADRVALAKVLVAENDKQADIWAKDVKAAEAEAKRKTMRVRAQNLKHRSVRVHKYSNIIYNIISFYLCKYN